MLPILKLTMRAAVAAAPALLGWALGACGSTAGSSRSAQAAPTAPPAVVDTDRELVMEEPVDQVPTDPPGTCGATAVARSGFAVCQDGRVHRPAPAACPFQMPDDMVLPTIPAVASGVPGACRRNADCGAKPNGYCAAEGQLGIHTCHYGCTGDSDCGAGALCMCDVPAGRCLPASCRSDQDCPVGRLCTRHLALRDHGYGAFACDSERDECNIDDDCRGDEAKLGQRSCSYEDGVRRCVQGVRLVY